VGTTWRVAQKAFGQRSEGEAERTLSEPRWKQNAARLRVELSRVCSSSLGSSHHREDIERKLSKVRRTSRRRKVCCTCPLIDSEEICYGF
jgi:hypothetical protein